VSLRDPLRLDCDGAVTNDGLVLRKTLDAYKTFGGYDVAYTGQTARWTFAVPRVSVTSATLVLSMSADDHATLIGDYRYTVCSGARAYETPVVLPHGTPAGAAFDNWVEVSVPADVVPGEVVSSSVSMRWWDKPLSSAGRGVLLVALGAVMASLDRTLPAGYVYVLRGAPFVLVSWVGWAAIVYGGVLIVGHWLFPPQNDRAVPPSGAREPAAPTERPKGAAARMACRKCGEIVELDRMENRECDDCRGVGKATYR